MSKQNDPPLGPKQLFGPGRSQLPTIQRRENQRQNNIRRQADARVDALNKRRNLDGSIGDVEAKEPVQEQQRPVVTEEEKKQALLTRLEEFKARNARERLQTLASRPKPFVVGKANLSTPSNIPKTPTHSAPSRLFTPNRVPFFGSGQSNRSHGSNKRLAPGSNNSRIPMPGFQRAKPNSVKKAVEPKATDAASSVPRAMGDNTLPPRPCTMPKPQEHKLQADGAGLNDTYEVDPEAVAGGGPGTDNEEKELDSGDEPVNTTITVENNSVNSNELPVVVVSPPNGEGKENEEQAASSVVWQPGATSSPERNHEADGGSQCAWYAGIKPAFTFEMPNVVGHLPRASNSAGINFTELRNDDVAVNDKEAAKEESQGSSGPVDGFHQDGKREVIVDETVPEIDSEGIVNSVATSGSVRRSTRSTRYTGSFKNVTPRRQTPAGPSLVSTKPKPCPLDQVPFDEDELMGPGIMEVGTPDSLLPMSASPIDSSSIMDDLASLDLTCTSDAPSQRPRVSTWTSLEVSSDEDDHYFKTPQAVSLTPQGDNNGGTVLDATFDASASSVPRVVSLPPTTPGSILRKEVGTSTQKKSVRFRHKLGSPIYFESGEPPAATPAKQVVASFARRQSAMPKDNNGGDMMSFTP